MVSFLNSLFNFLQKYGKNSNKWLSTYAELEHYCWVRKLESIHNVVYGDGVWRVEGSAAAVSRLQTACREKLMNTAALQCGPIRGEHSCHVTGSPPMRGQQWLCKQSGHMQPGGPPRQPGASTQVFAVRFLHHHPVPARHGPTQLTGGYQQYIHRSIMHTLVRVAAPPCLIYPLP